MSDDKKYCMQCGAPLYPDSYGGFHCLHCGARFNSKSPSVAVQGGQQAPVADEKAIRKEKMMFFLKIGFYIALGGLCIYMVMSMSDFMNFM